MNKLHAINNKYSAVSDLIILISYIFKVYERVKLGGLDPLNEVQRTRLNRKSDILHEVVPEVLPTVIAQEEMPAAKRAASAALQLEQLRQMNLNVNAIASQEGNLYYFLMLHIPFFADVNFKSHHGNTPA